MKAPALPGMATSDDLYQNGTNSFTEAIHDIPTLDSAYPGRRPGHNQIASFQFEYGRQMGNDLGHIPDQLVEVALLLDFAIDLQPDGALGQVAHLVDRDDVCHRRGMLEGLADLPGTARFLGFILQIASRHVQTQGIAVDVVERLFDRDVGATLADGNDHFHFMVDIACHRRVREIAVVQNQIVRVLLEEEWQFTVRVMAHLAGVFRIVSADTVNYAHRVAGNRAPKG